jgi:hypothetical protein
MAIGGQILVRLSEPKTVSKLWDEVRLARDPRLGYAPLSFDWFVLALAFLYGIKAIEMSRGRIHKSVTK